LKRCWRSGRSISWGGIIWGIRCARWAGSDDALDSLRKAVEKKPDYAEAYNNMGIVLRPEGRPGKTPRDRMTRRLLCCGRIIPGARETGDLVYLLMGNFSRRMGGLRMALAGGRRGTNGRKYPGKL